MLAAVSDRSQQLFFQLYHSFLIVRKKKVVDEDHLHASLRSDVELLRNALRHNNPFLFNGSAIFHLSASIAVVSEGCGLKHLLQLKPHKIGL